MAVYRHPRPLVSACRDGKVAMASALVAAGASAEGKWCEMWEKNVCFVCVLYVLRVVGRVELWKLILFLKQIGEEDINGIPLVQFLWDHRIADSSRT